MKTKLHPLPALEAEKRELKPPKLYKVLLFNDDYTSMDFVITVLQKFFSHNRERATTLMLQVHTQGSAVCGVYTFEIAETKVSQVAAFAKQHEHPLRCELEGRQT